MQSRHLSFVLAALGVGLALIWTGPAQTEEQPAPQGVEVLARGPVHEAYAEPTDQAPQASPVVPKQPPAPIEEMPPDQKPEGDNVQWIPGYWSWDDDQSDFLWVSGFWRAIPPGRQWVSGHWQQVDNGWQRVAGFWAAAEQTEVEYVPPPPPPLDAGPSVPAPDATSTYVSGVWVYRQTRFVWRPGFWMGYRPNWCWIPARYVWTPAGCVFVEGYWDYPLHDRGLLFAPVRIDYRVVTPGWYYTPRYVVSTDFLMGALFVRPASHQYYFGDYFEDRYERHGFVPWVDFRVGRYSYDPNYSYYRHHFAETRGWERGLQELYAARLRGDVPRPPHTLVQQTQVINNITVNNTQNVTVNKNINLTNIQNSTVLAPITQVNNTHVTNLAALGHPVGTPIRNVPAATHVVKLEQVPQQQRIQAQQTAAHFHEASQQRRQVEAKVLSQGAPVKPTDPPKTVKLELPKAPAAPVEKKPPTRTPPPPLPTLPKHEEKPIPPVQPKTDVKPVEPLKKDVTPPPPPPKKDTTPPPPPPKKDTTPPPPPKKDVTPPPPPPMKDTTPPPKKDTTPPPPPPPKKDTVPPPPPPKKDTVPPPPPPPPPPKKDTPPPPPPKKDTPPPPPPKKDGPNPNNGTILAAPREKAANHAVLAPARR